MLRLAFFVLIIATGCQAYTGILERKLQTMHKEKNQESIDQDSNEKKNRSDTELDWNKPKFCRHYNCPKFTVLEEHPGLQIRKYAPSGYWASVMYPYEPSLGEMRTASKAFKKLFGYINGMNETGEMIDMTVPVITRLVEQTGDFQSHVAFLMAFWIDGGRYIQAAPPKPLDDEIRLHNHKRSTKAAVRGFGGFPTGGSDWLQEQVYLIQDMKAAGIELPNGAKLAYAGYNAPYDLKDRHQEVIIGLGCSREGKDADADEDVEEDDD